MLYQDSFRAKGPDHTKRKRRVAAVKLRQFEFLSALKEYGTISRVAQQLYTSQPAVSIAIKELETELGYPLLRRTNRGILFTDQGELVLEQAEIILKAVERIRQVASYSEGNLQGCLKVGGLPHLCNTLLLNVQMELQEQFPQFSLMLEGQETVTLVQAVENGALNLAVIQMCDLVKDGFRQRMAREQLQYRPLFTDRLTFVVASDHPLLLQKRITLEDLRRYPFAVFGEGTNQHVLELTERTGYPDQIIRFYEMVRMRKYMSLYQAVTVLPQRAIAHGNSTYQVQFAPLWVDWVNWETEVGWLHSSEPLSQAERMVVDSLVQQCANPEFLNPSL